MAAPASLADTAPADIFPTVVAQAKAAEEAGFDANNGMCIPCRQAYQRERKAPPAAANSSNTGFNDGTRRSLVSRYSR